MIMGLHTIKGITGISSRIAPTYTYMFLMGLILIPEPSMTALFQPRKGVNTHQDKPSEH